MLVQRAFFIPLDDKPIAEMKAEFENMIIYTEPVFIATSFIIPDFINFSYTIYNRIVDNLLTDILDKAEIGKLNSSDYAALAKNPSYTGIGIRSDISLQILNSIKLITNLLYHLLNSLVVSMVLLI